MVDFEETRKKLTIDAVPSEVDPYEVETIAKFLGTAENEKQRDEYIVRLMKYTLKRFDELGLERIIDYLTGKLGIKKKVIDYIVSRMKKEIEDDKRKDMPIMNFKVDNYLENVEAFYKKQPFFYDNIGLFWLWREDHWEEVDEIDIMNLIDDSLYIHGQTIKPSVKHSYLETIKRIGRRNKPEKSPHKWVQFKQYAYSLKSGKKYKVQPNYFFTNPIPWELGETSNTPVMDNLFKEWVGENYVKTLYECIAYCCYTSYPIQSLFCLYGHGRNGKSCFLRLLSKFVGMNNLCSTELDLLAGANKSRFETYKLYKKLVCLMGETNFGVLTHSSVIKRLCGGDVIGFEKKGKDSFDDFSYDKLIIASNSRPISEDTCEGFYLRWVIIDFPNDFREG